MIIFAAGLLDERLIQIEENVEIAALDAFTASRLAEEGINVGDTQPLSVLLAIKHPDFNLGYPEGTTPDFAAQSFERQTPSTVSQTLAAEVDVFSPDLSCEKGAANATPKYADTWTCFNTAGDSIQVDLDSEDNELDELASSSICSRLEVPEYVANITTSTCSIVNATIRAAIFQQPSFGTAGSPVEGYNGRAQLVNCSSEVEPNKGDKRILISLFSTFSSERTEVDVKGGVAIDHDPRIKETRSTHLVCKPKYTIRHGRVELRGNSNTTFIDAQALFQADSRPRTLNGLSQDSFTELFAATLQGTSVVNRLFASNNSLDVDPSLQLLFVANPNRKIEEFLDAEILEDGYRSIFKEISVQLAKTRLTQRTNSTFLGTSSIRTERILVSRLSFGLLQGAFILTYLITGLLLFILSDWRLPLDPKSLAEIAMLTKESRQLLETLEPFDCLRRTGIEVKLSGRLYRIENDERRFSIKEFDPLASGSAENLASPNAKRRNIVRQHLKIPRCWGRKPLNTTKSAWRFWALKWWGMAIFVGGLIALIVGLEVSLVQINGSDVLHGNEPAQKLTYAWRYVPVVVMTLASLLLGSSLSGAIITTMPYIGLRRGNALARDSMLMDYVSRPSIASLALAMSRSHWEIAIASMVAILASVLAVVAGGLFVVENTDITGSVNMTRLGWFTPKLFKEDTNPAPGISAGIIVQHKASYPPTVYRDVVLPRLVLAQPKDNGRFADGLTRFEVQVPVLYPQLSCTVLPRDTLSIEMREGEDGKTMYGPSLYLDKVPPCAPTFGIPGIEDPPDVEVDIGAHVIGKVKPNSYVGAALPFPAPWVDCPNFIVTFGKREDDKFGDVTTLGCTGWVEEMEAKISLSVGDDDGYKVVGPIEIFPGTAQNFSNFGLSFLSRLFDKVRLGKNDDTSAVDSFMQAAIYGTNGVSPENLLGKNGTDVTRLNNRIAEVYRIVAAQYIDIEWRTNPDEEAHNVPGEVFLASAVSPNYARLKQNLIETRLLVSLLGAELLLVLAAYALVRPRHVIPKNPHSIASVASLLAGSRLITALRGCEVVALVDFFAGKTFSLKEWQGEDGGRTRFGIDQERPPPEIPHNNEE